MAKPPRVKLQNRQRRLRVDSTGLRRLAARVLDEEGADPRLEIELVLLRDAAMAALNARYRQRSGPTDVLAFPAVADAWPAEEPPLLGTIVVSVDRAVEQAAARRLAVPRELARLVVHGVLHLCGYRDGSPAERARMRRREDRYLNTRTARR